MKALGQFTLAVISVALYIFVLSKLYGWFAIPAGAPVIGMANIYGLAMIVSYITFKNKDIKDSQEKDKGQHAEIAALRIVMSLMVLLVGYIVTLFI